MTITDNQFVGKWAVPTNHPVTCANPAPWLIHQMRLQVDPVKIFIRGENSMWFRADQCYIGTKDECVCYQENT